MGVASEASDTEVDAVVVGAGFAGLYAIYKLRSLGLSVQAYEAAPDVGGTWWWNCYPGARCDVESLDYCYVFDDDLLREWKWSERFPTQPEVLSYAQHVADRFDLRRHIRFETAVTSAHWERAGNHWAFETDRGDRTRARYFISAVGAISAPNLPPLEGLETFAGRVLMTSRWPHDGVDLAGHRVAVIGTGSSGIQAIPMIAQDAAHLTVFQRTANFSCPARNGPIEPEREASVRADYAGYRQACLKNGAGTPSLLLSQSAFDLSEEDRTAAYEAKWARGGAGGIPALFADTRTDMAANDTAAEFVREKIRSIVTDPAVAEALCPTDHPIATKRICLDTDYYATYNRANVTLVDLEKTPIERVTPTAITTTDGEFEVDDIVFATGFDAVTGALLRMDVRGAGDLALADVWANGPETYLGLMVSGFPNMFTITGPLSPSVLANVMVAIAHHVEWIGDCIGYMADHGYDCIEAAPEAQAEWTEEVQRIADGTLFPLANSWYNGDNIPGKPRRFLAYIGGFPAYASRCEEVVKAGYEGFTMSVGGTLVDA
ncbi:MAG: NAD(P)/FAD-dependent oxidoreductase [Actinomycetota bacterium]|nr:NAD(P)/FAD-dependent oxidoreductase [Actinomycetota bacterium]